MINDWPYLKEGQGEKLGRKAFQVEDCCVYGVLETSLEK